MVYTSATCGCVPLGFFCEPSFHAAVCSYVSGVMRTHHLSPVAAYALLPHADYSMGRQNVWRKRLGRSPRARAGFRLLG